MVEIKTVYKGEYTNRRTDKFRQVGKGIQRLVDVGVPEGWINPEETENHEKAHIVGHKPGRSGRMIARVLVNKRNKIKGWSIEHQVDPNEKLSVRGREIVVACLAPAFVKGRKSYFPSIVDVAGAVSGGMVIGLEVILGKKG